MNDSILLDVLSFTWMEGFVNCLYSYILPLLPARVVRAIASVATAAADAVVLFVEGKL